MSRALPHQYHQQFPPPRTPVTSPLDFTDRIPFNELKLSKKTLGSGSFGTVYQGHWRSKTVAVKQFKTREEIDSFLIEVKQLSCVKHPNIVTLYGASTLADTAYLIMEYAEGGSLNHLLHENKQQDYDLRHACSWAMQTARGVAYLHGIRPKPIMHRDLKPANLLLFSRGKILKICDFGTACTVATQMTNNTGSASYMAPEVFATSSYLESGDVFSWSIIFWEILARRHPYSGQFSNPYQILWRVKQEGTRPNELESCPKIIWRLITRSWDTDPRKRPCMLDVAHEMGFIFSLTEKPSLDKQQQPEIKSPTSQMYPMCSQRKDKAQIQQYDHQSHQVLSHESKNQQSFITRSLSTTSSNNELLVDEKELRSFRIRRSYALLGHKLGTLQRRHKELMEKVQRCDKQRAWDTVEECEHLQKLMERAMRQMAELKLRQTTSTFSDQESVVKIVVDGRVNKVDSK